jgi:hypothetical protein
VNIEEQTLLLDDLQNLLEKQIEMVRRSDFSRIESLAEQAGLYIEKITDRKYLEQPEFVERREHLTQLYRKLELMLISSKDSIADQLQQVGNVRKTLAAYRNKG